MSACSKLYAHGYMKVRCADTLHRYEFHVFELWTAQELLLRIRYLDILETAVSEELR